jgi:methenyltetrahydromethanopterin cyclohydrolase
MRYGESGGLVFSVNQKAVAIVKNQIIPNIEELNCEMHILANGARVIDMGVSAPGGYVAAKLFVDATIGGLGQVQYGTFSNEKLVLPSIDVYIDHPQEACLSSQFSGWKLPGEGFPGNINPIGSGPARAIARNDIFSQAWGYQDRHHETVFAAQTQILPDETMAETVAEACGIRPENVYILAARTGSLVGSIQVCSRTVEASIWRLYRKDFDISKIISGSGTCPLPPPVFDEFLGMDRVNTALLYGVTVRYIVNCRDEEIEAVIDKAPFNASKRFGERFADIFEEGKRDFYLVDKDIHTVARYEMVNWATGNSFSAGEIRVDMLRESFGCL